MTGPIVLAAATDTHPGAVAYVLPALLVWLAGHTVLALAQHSLERGLEAGASAGRPASPWPWSVVVVLVLSGLTSGVALVLVGRWLFERVTLDLLEFLALGWTILHLPCFVGVALRRRWGRYYAAATALAWALLGLIPLGDSIWHGQPTGAREWVLGIGALLVFGTLSLRLLRSEVSRRYFL